MTGFPSDLETADGFGTAMARGSGNARNVSIDASFKFQPRRQRERERVDYTNKDPSIRVLFAVRYKRLTMDRERERVQNGAFSLHAHIDERAETDDKAMLLRQKLWLQRFPAFVVIKLPSLCFM